MISKGIGKISRSVLESCITSPFNRVLIVIVVGSGGAGAHAAGAAAESGARVLVVSKDPVGASDTKISEGIATVRASGAADNDDSEGILSENLKMAGADLPLDSITNAFAADSQLAYDRYRAQGLRPGINKMGDGPQALPLPLPNWICPRT